MNLKNNPSVKLFFLKRAFSVKNRIVFYEILSSLLTNHSSIENAVKKIASLYQKYYQKSIDSKKIIGQIAEAIYTNLTQHGKTAIDAIAPYIPESELAILASAKHLTSESLTNTAHVAKKISYLRSSILKKIFMPVIYVTGLVFLLGIVYFSLNPIIEATGNLNKLPLSTIQLVQLSTFVMEYAYLIVIALIGIGSFCIFSIPHMTHAMRYQVLDYIPPFSIYKKITAITFILSLSMCIKTKNISIKQALHIIQHHSGKYLHHYIKKMLLYLSQGIPVGQILCQSPLFSKEILIPLHIYSSSDHLEKGIRNIAEEQLEKIIQSILKIIQGINLVLMLFFGLFIAWFASAILSLDAMFTN